MNDVKVLEGRRGVEDVVTTILRTKKQSNRVSITTLIA
jgi:hypothetical protein